jgi:hypothetical protein
MKAKTHFAFRIDAWDATGNNVVEQLAGLDDYTMAIAAYRAAVDRPRGSTVDAGIHPRRRTMAKLTARGRKQITC